MKSLNMVDWVVVVLVVVGAVNWGLVGLFNFDVVSFVFGSVPMLARLVYVVVGLAGVYFLVSSMRYVKKE